MTGSAPLTGTLLATTVLIALHWLLAHLAALKPSLSWILEGKPIELGSRGKIHGGMYLRHAVTEADLNEALRQRGIEDVESTRKIVLEPSGKIAVLKKGQGSADD